MQQPPIPTGRMPIGTFRRLQHERALRLSFDDIAPWFNTTAEHAAGQLGLRSTAFKRMCRRNGIHRWPYRRLRSLRGTISIVQRDLHQHSGLSANPVQIEALENQLRSLEAQLRILCQPKSPNPKPNPTISLPILPSLATMLKVPQPQLLLEHWAKKRKARSRADRMSIANVLSFRPSFRDPY